MEERAYHCYIIASKTWVLYTGVTGKLRQRMLRHKAKKWRGFSAKYNCDRLAWSESFDHPSEAIAREKQIKGWKRSRKLELIRRENPNLDDLAADWFTDEQIAFWRENYESARQEANGTRLPSS